MNDGSTSDVPRPREPWHQNVGFLVGAIIILGPFSLPLIWTNKKLPLLTKLGLSVIVVALTLLLLRATGDMMENLQARLAEIREIQGR